MTKRFVEIVKMNRFPNYSGRYLQLFFKNLKNIKYLGFFHDDVFSLQLRFPRGSPLSVRLRVGLFRILFYGNEVKKSRFKILFNKRREGRSSPLDVFSKTEEI